MRRSPAFALAAIGILALGLAANTAVFSVADAVLFRPLAYNRPVQLVVIAEMIPQYSHLYPRIPVKAIHFYEWRNRCRSFSDLAILDSGSMNLTSNDGPPERFGSMRVSANFLPLLGVAPALGRNFTAEEDRPDADRVVILTDGLWRRRFHASPSILNTRIMLNGSPHVVAGVLPPWFRFPRPDLISPIGSAAMNVDILKPIAFDRSKLRAVGNFSYAVIARLRVGVTRRRAEAELNAVQAALTKEFAISGMELRAVVTAMQDQMVGRARRGLLVLLGAIGVVLLIVCVNLGNLMLARAAAQWRETAVRVALGAAPWRIVRQVLTESALISLGGGVVGFALAYAAMRALVAAAPVDLPRLDEVRIDYRALAAKAKEPSPPLLLDEMIREAQAHPQRRSVEFAVSNYYSRLSQRDPAFSAQRSAFSRRLPTDWYRR